jgi:excisionase family DNA binding protein
VLLLSIEEVSRALSLGRSTVYELISAGKLEVVHIGRAARVTVSSLEAFIRSLPRRPLTEVGDPRAASG